MGPWTLDFEVDVELGKVTDRVTCTSYLLNLRNPCRTLGAERDWRASLPCVMLRWTVWEFERQAG